MNKTYRDEFRRLFLLEHLPEPVRRSDAHLQIYDNYIFNTRLRLRSVRVPETKQWTWLLQQKFAVGEELSCWKIAEINLNEAEHAVFKIFEGHELRKNRYYFESDGRRIEVDSFLGDLFGLNLARVCFDTAAEMEDFQFPFPVVEVTGDRFFLGENLYDKTFAEIEREAAALIKNAHSQDTLIRELAKENE